MKNFTLSILVLFSQISFSQDVVRTELVSFQTNEKNSKNITFTLTQKNKEKGIVIKAKKVNETYSLPCKWEVEINEKEAKLFVNKLKSAIVSCNSNLDADWITSNTIMKCSNNRIKIKMQQAVCVSGHQTGYFQKKCNKKLNFTIDKKTGREIVKKLNDLLNNNQKLVVEK